jgi:hypothetical protein
MQLVIITQYFDTIKSIGEMDKTNTLFPVARAGSGARHFRADHAVDAGRRAGEGLASAPDIERHRRRPRPELTKS